jgi:molybdenum storage protein
MTNSDPGFAAKDVPSALMRQTLVDRDLVKPVATHPTVRLLPWLHVVAIGGRSIIDRGREALEPVVSELRAALDEYKMLIATGPGIRARHVFGIALDLGLPTGALASLASTEAEQNGHIVAALLAEDGVSYLPHTSVSLQLAAHLAASPAVVSNGFPPYELFEFPPAVGKIPPHRTDSGAFLIADAYGAARVVFVKDVDGVFTADPETAAEGEAELIPRVGAGELLAMDLPTLPIDRIVLELMANAKHQKEIQIVNGLVPGNITKALAGEHVGTIVYAD